MKFIFLLFAVFCLQAFAQKENLNARDPRLNEGSLFTIQIAPAGKKITVSLAGKPGAELSPGKVIVFGREISNNGQSRKLEIRPSGSQFEILGNVPSGQPLEIEVQDMKDRAKKETFKLEMP